MLRAHTETKNGNCNSTFTNYDSKCSYLIGVSTYKVHDSEGEHDEIHGCKQAVIGPKSSVTLSVPQPSCNYRSDAYVGDPLTSLAKGACYGSKELDHEEGDGGKYCPDQCPRPSPPPWGPKPFYTPRSDCPQDPVEGMLRDGVHDFNGDHDEMRGPPGDDR